MKDRGNPMDLFTATAAAEERAAAPLAERMRPATLAEYVGQEHLLGEGKLLRRLIEQERPQFVVPELEAIATEALGAVERDGLSKVIPSARAVQLTAMKGAWVRALW